MTKDEIIAVLGILRNQCWVGSTRETIMNDTTYKLICSAIGKLERNLLALAAFPLNTMNPEEIKIGETYNVRMPVTDKTAKFIYTKTGVNGIIDGYCFANQESFAFSPMTAPANGTKSAKTAQKYDPCRLFRKGDKVRVVQYKGRHFNNETEHLCLCEGIVTFNERKGEYVDVSVTYGTSEEDIEIDPAYLELITPAEEIEPYSVHESEVVNGFDIVREKMCVMTFPYGSKEAGYYRNKLEAKEAAETECDRLNAEYRAQNAEQTAQNAEYRKEQE